MKIVIIIYAVSWLILSGIFIASRFSKHYDSTDKNPWYLYALIIAIAPLAVLIVPYILYEDWKEKKSTKAAEKWKHKQEERKLEAIANYRKGAELTDAYPMDVCIKVAHAFQGCILNRDFNSILDILNDLKLPSGYSLCIESAKEEGIGSNSRLYVDVNGEKDFDIWKYFRLEDTHMSAWQVYLLYKAHHSLPCFWHGAYENRSWVYTDDDLGSIAIINEEHSNLPSILKEKNYNINPGIVKTGDKYYVTSCYWTNWGGLEIELVEITLKDGKVADIYDVTSETLFKYDCGILF